MANVCDYVKWRGDITLEQSKFNEIDNLILSRFSYFPFDKIIEELRIKHSYINWNGTDKLRKVTKKIKKYGKVETYNNEIIYWSNYI